MVSFPLYLYFPSMKSRVDNEGAHEISYFYSYGRSSARLIRGQKIGNWDKGIYLSPSLPSLSPLLSHYLSTLLSSTPHSFPLSILSFTFLFSPLISYHFVLSYPKQPSRCHVSSSMTVHNRNQHDLFALFYLSKIEFFMHTAG